MERKAVSGIMLILLLISMLTLAPPIQLTLSEPETILYIDPSETKVSVDNTFIIDVNLDDVIDLYGYNIWLSYDTSFLDVISVDPPHLLPEPMIEIIEPDGIIHIYKILLPHEPSVSGSGTLASITFNATALGSCILDPFDTKLVDSYLSLIPHIVIDGSVTVLSMIHDRWAVIEDVNGDRLKVETASDEIWSTLVELYHNRSERWIGGIVEKYDNKWGFRFDPNTIIIAEVTIEAIQTTIRGISENLDYWLGGMACVAAKVVEINPLRVPEDYPTIQEAINAASDGGTILVASGTYYENVVVNKENLTLIGENKDTTIIDGNRVFTTMRVTTSNIKVNGFTIQNGYYFGVSLEHSNNSIIADNNIINNRYGGIAFSYYSSGNNITRNKISNHMGYGIDLGADGNYIVGNDISNNQYGVVLYASRFNLIYHNNFINNSIQAWVIYEGYASVWDNGYPSGGNYWSDYAGEDNYSGLNQDQSGSDGIGDTPYTIDADNQDGYPLMKPYGGPRDIGIKVVTTSKTVVGQGYSLNITVTILNYGIYTEDRNVTVYANTTAIASQNVTLTSRNSTTITFTWNTTGFAYGNYTISAYATPVPDETDIADNTLADGAVMVTIPGDANGDRIVDIFDIGTISAHWYPGPPVGPLGYDANVDINGDGAVDIFDIGITSAHWGQSW